MSNESLFLNYIKKEGSNINNIDNIIDGSKNWQKIPDKYSIQCIEYCLYRLNTNVKIFLFSFVKKVGQEYAFYNGLATIPNDCSGIVILDNEKLKMPKIFIRKDEDLKYIGTMYREGLWNNSRVPKFKNIWHYSATNPKQKIDEDCPEWLKTLAIENKANVAYFQF